MAHARRTHDAEAVHKLRVSIRRLQQALRLFGEFLDERETRRVKKQLRTVLRAAAEVRNRDIAAKLVASTGASETLVAQLESERRNRMTELLRLLRSRRRTQGHWRARLGL
jgi:CHAD domain-containing protein